MANYDKEIFDLGQVLGYLGRTINFENEPQAPEILNTGLSYYHEYFKLTNKLKQTPAFAQDTAVKNYLDFQRRVAPTQINDIILFFRNLEEEPEEKETKKAKVPEKEDSTVPAELETLVAQYKESQADQIDADTTHTVADAVKRARKTWEIKHQADLIRENRLALIQDKTEREKQREMEDLERDLFLVKTVDPKAETASLVYRDIENISRQAVIAQAANLGLGLSESQIKQATRDLSYLGLTGALDFNNFRDLNTLSQLAFRNLEGLEVDSPINKIDAEYQAWQQANASDPYSDKPDEIEKQINSSDEESQQYFAASAENLSFQLKKNNLDLDNDLEAAEKQLGKLQKSLLVAIPNAKLAPPPPTPLHQNYKAFESVLRQADPQLRINPNEIGSQVIGLLQVTKGENRNISPEAVRLFSLGLDVTKLNHLIATNPKLNAFVNTKVGKDIYQQVRYQLGKIAKSKLGEEIKNNIKPLSGISESLAGFYNRNPAVKVVKVVLDPIGSAKSWAGRMAGRQIGQHLIENSGSLLAKKLGSYLVEHGLQNGIKAFSKAAAKKALIKAATWAALKLGISLTAESLNAIMPGLGLLVDIALQIAVWVTEKTIGAAYNAFQSAAESIYGEKIKARDVLALLAAPVAVAATAGAVAFGGFVFIVRTAQIAVVSAVGIIISAVVTIGLYLGFAYLIAPMLSTLVQLDSVEKVDYSEYAPEASSSGDCAWPTKGHYSIVTGPNGGTHYLSHLEAIDIGAPGGSPHLSATSGIVVYTGVYSNYGNTVHVQTKNSAGSFVVIYGHLTGIFVSKGQQIAQGKVIGIVGGSGGWSPHIHMEYKGIKYNQCPAGGLKIKEGCCTPYPGGVCTGACNAFSN